MSKLRIEWNPKAEAYLSPTQRDSIERGDPPRRLDGEIDLNGDGHVWFRCAGASKIVGTWNAPEAESRASDELDAPDSLPGMTNVPPARSAKRAPKAKAKSKK